MTKKIKSVISIVVVLMLVLSLAACSSGSSTGGGSSTAGGSSSTSPGEPELTFTIYFANPGELYERAANYFAEKVDELSGGKIKGKVIPNGTLGGDRELAEALQVGTVNTGYTGDICLDLVTKDPIGWAMLPNTFKDYDEADKFYNNGWIGEEIGKSLEKDGIVTLAMCDNLFRNLALTKPAYRLADLKGVKVRVAEQEDVVKYYSLLGCLPVTITAGEVVTALQQKTVDGVDTNIQTFLDMGFLPFVDYILVTNWQYSSSRMSASKVWWDTLSPEHQKIIRDAARETGVWYRGEMRKKEREVLDNPEKYGVEIIYPDDTFKAELQNVASKMWDDAWDKYDEAILNRLISDLKLPFKKP